MSQTRTEMLDVSSFSSDDIGHDGILLLDAIGEISSDTLVRDVTARLLHCNWKNIKASGDPKGHKINAHLKAIQQKVKQSTSSINISTAESTPMIRR